MYRVWEVVDVEYTRKRCLIVYYVYKRCLHESGCAEAVERFVKMFVNK